MGFRHEGLQNLKKGLEIIDSRCEVMDFLIICLPGLVICQKSLANSKAKGHHSNGTSSYRKRVTHGGLQRK
jgi:hypothetical protein